MMRNAAIAGILLAVVFAVVSCSDDSTGSKESTPPQVEIQTPWDGSQREGIVDVVIDATDAAGIKEVQFYGNNQLVGTDLTSPFEFEWDLSGFADGTDISFYAKAVDNNGNSKTSEVWTLTKGQSDPPVATLSSPADGWTVMQGYLTELKGVATDTEDGVLTAENIIWSSDLQGVLKSGSDVEYRGFVLGTHKITMTAIDSDGNKVSETVTITVEENDQDYAYIQEGSYRIGPPLYDATTVRFSKPFIMSKTELSLKEFLDNVQWRNHLLRPQELTGRGDYISEDAQSTGLPIYDAALVEDVDTYGNYPAVFWTMLEYIAYCESINERDGYNTSYVYFDNSGEIAERVPGYVKPTFMTQVDPTYELNGWRLPTEAEWMVAASGGVSSENNGIELPAYPWGNELPYNRANTLAGTASPEMTDISLGRGTLPVDSFKSSQSPFGILNMAGNVAEVCSDIYMPFLPSGTDFIGFNEEFNFEYVVKGGAWYSNSLDARISVRTMWMPFVMKVDGLHKNAISSGIGARIVRSLNVGEAPW